MPDRALRRFLAGPEGKVILQFVRMHPMPDRALRPVPCGGQTNDDDDGPNASNARQGIKTHLPGHHSSLPGLQVRMHPMPDRALRRRPVRVDPEPAYRWVRMHPMPDRALRLFWNVAQVSAGRRCVRMHPMPDRALRPTTVAADCCSPAGVRMHPMPDRALRPCRAGRCVRMGAASPNASNARQGIKTSRPERPVPRNMGRRPNASNARQGIKTDMPESGRSRPGRVRMHPMPDRALRRTLTSMTLLAVRPVSPNASNARQGIKTLARHRGFPGPGRCVRMHPMPDRALRLSSSTRWRRRWSCVRMHPMPDRPLRPTR